MTRLSESMFTPIFKNIMQATFVTALVLAFIVSSHVEFGSNVNSAQSTPFAKSHPASATNAESAGSNATMTTVYRCDASDGKRHYLSYPNAGCEEIYVVSPPVSAMRHTLVSYNNRDAGYRWAESHNVTDPSDCSGDSQGFVIGCQAYATQAIASADTSRMPSI